MRKNRTYPTYVNRTIPVPEWAKTPFVPHGLPPAMIFSIGQAKSIAKHEWSRFGEFAPSEDAIKSFVFSFHWRWKGDQSNRFEVLARWAYEFLAENKKELARRRVRQKASAQADREGHPGIELTEFAKSWLGSELDTPPAPQPSLSREPSRLSPGKIKRFILLNPSRKPGKGPKKPKHQL